MNITKEAVNLEYFLSPYKNVHAFKHVIGEVSSCYAARELSIRYVFIERKRGDEEIFRADILSDTHTFTGIQKLISVPPTLFTLRSRYAQ